MTLLTALTLACTPIVTDGDTFRCNGERIRIVDIDAAEMNGKCPAERRLAIMAKARLSQLLQEPFRLARSGRDVDRYGRKLRVVVRVRDNRSVGDILVSERLARTGQGGANRGADPLCNAGLHWS